MTTEEFSNEFDILYNNISSNAAPGLNEYEKSVLLTKAQLEIVRNYFNPKSNKNQEGYDESPKRQIDFSCLTKVAYPTLVVEDPTKPYSKIDERSILYRIPSDVLYILTETATNTYDTDYVHKINIVPISYSDYNTLISRPFKFPVKQQGWRLIEHPGGASNCIVEIIAKGSISNYKIRYVRMPNPIILIDLNTDNDNGETFTPLTIQGISTRTECELDSSIHSEILQRAVELSKNAFLGDINSTVQLGTRSE